MNEPIRLIGLCGPKGSGKTTLAKLVATKLGWDRYSFAEPLREMLGLMGLRGKDFEMPWKERPLRWLGDGKVTPRRLLQTLGTDWARAECGGNVWVDVLFERVQRDAAGGALSQAGVIVDDVRFAEEAVAIRARGGVVVRCGEWPDGALPEHASEAPLPSDLIDFELRGDYANREGFLLSLGATLAPHFGPGGVIERA